MILQSDESLDVRLPDDSAMRVHWFRPADEGRYPGVLLFSEIYQVTGPIRRLAATLAGNGHVVAVPEVFHEYEPAGTVLDYDPSGTDRGNMLKYAKPVAAYDGDAEVGLTALMQHPACDGRLATFGVCLGGPSLIARRSIHGSRRQPVFMPRISIPGRLGRGARMTASREWLTSRPKLCLSGGGRTPMCHLRPDRSFAIVSNRSALIMSGTKSTHRTPSCAMKVPVSIRCCPNR